MKDTEQTPATGFASFHQNVRCILKAERCTCRCSCVSVHCLCTGTCAGKICAQTTTPEAAVNEGRHVCPEMTSQPRRESTEPCTSIPGFKNSSTEAVELLECSAQETANTSLEGAGRTDEDLFESGDTATAESEPAVDDIGPVRTAEEETSVVNEYEELKLNTTYTICSPEGHLEDPQTVLSQSLSNTPRQAGEGHAVP